MTLATTVSRVQYSPNGTTTAFSFPYDFIKEAHLVVTITSALGADTVQVLVTDYTTTGEGVPGGGTVTMLSPPASGTTLTIARDVPVTQLTDYIANDDFKAETHEVALDKLTMICQQLDSDNGALGNRAIQVPLTEPSTTVVTLPALVNRKNVIVGFNAAGDVIVTDTATIAAAIVPLSALTVAAPTGTATIKTITIATGATNVYYEVKAWLIDDTHTVPVLNPTLSPPDQNNNPNFEDLTDLSGNATFSFEHRGASQSWKLVVMVQSTIVLSTTLTLGV